MSLSNQSAMLTTTAKASGRKLTLTVIKNLDKDRQPWMAEVVLKSGLLGQHDTIRTKWVPQNQDYQVKVTGMAQAKAQPSLKEETSSSITSMEAGSDGEFTTGSGGEVKKEKSSHTRGVGTRSTSYLMTPGKPVVIIEHADAGSDGEGEDEDLDNMQLEQRLQRMEILNRMRELEHVQLLRDAELANVRKGVVVTAHADRAFTGLYGLRENNLVENLINTECAKHKVWTHPVSGREETQTEREVRMILYDMMVTSLQNFKSMYSGEHVGDNYAVLRNVMTYGAPSSMRMRIDLTKKLGNYSKQTHQGYQDFELGLQHLSNDLCNVGMTMSQDELTLRLIAGMTSDKRYEKECREVSERAESYSTCNSVFVQRAQALGNLTSTPKPKDEANALEEGKGKGGKGRGGRGKGGKGAETGSPSDYENSSKSPCYKFLAGKECPFGDECRFEHVTQKKLDAKKKKKKDKNKTQKKPKKGAGSDSESEGSDSASAGSDSASEKTKSPRKAEAAEQKAKRHKKQPCFQFQQTGSCANGKKCKYDHVAAAVSDSESSN